MLRLAETTMGFRALARSIIPANCCERGTTRRLGVLTGTAAGFGVLMNLNYLLSGTVSINPIPGVLRLFLVISWRICSVGFMNDFVNYFTA